LYSPLDRKQLDEIHLATLKVLERTGVIVYDDDVLKLLESAGCTVDPNTKLVKFPKKVIDATLQKTPDKVVLGGRDKAHDLLVERGTVLTRPGSGYTKILDIETDEIITGFGRTGRLFGYQHSGAEPDLLVLAKGMASGFPISAVLGTEEIMRSPKIMPTPTEFLPRVTSTFMGYPIGCAAALASINVITKERLPERAAELGAHLKKRSEEMQDEHKIIGEVRSKGLMAGIELVKDKESKKPASKETIQAVQEAHKRGVIVNPGGTFENLIGMGPPLVITREQLDCGLGIMNESIGAVEKALG